MKIVCVGDNVVDCYVDEGIYYPGGNSVNVAVNCKRNGVEEVNYIGVFGDDDKAEAIKESLQEEGVTIFRSRKVYAPSAQPRVRLVNSDRVFERGPRDTCQHLFSMHITAEDIEFIKNYDIIHSSCYSNIEYELPTLSSIADVAYDYSDKRSDEYIERTAPYVSYAFFSASDLSEEECIALAEKTASYGTKIVGLTRGSLGSIFFKDGKIYRQGIKKIKAVDTMGAGDSFIAAFLSSYPRDNDIKKALEYAAERSAYSCTISGSWGHPYKL